MSRPQPAGVNEARDAYVQQLLKTFPPITAEQHAVVTALLMAPAEVPAAQLATPRAS